MSLPGHRRTSSHKRRRASHFALKAPAITTSKTGAHRMHVAAPDAAEYNGHAIHIKGRDRKLAKLVNKSKAKTKAHDHAGHDHDHAAAE